MSLSRCDRFDHSGITNVLFIREFINETIDSLRIKLIQLQRRELCETIFYILYILCVETNNCCFLEVSLIITLDNRSTAASVPVSLSLSLSLSRIKIATTASR